MRPLYDYAWFVGFGVAAIVYGVAMMAFARKPAVDAAPLKGER
jgi:cytosine/uracil/thiamine/allantoin permease